jgi:hypothetical protein
MERSRHERNRSTASVLGAISARETYRIHLNDLGHREAVAVSKQGYDRLRAQSLAASAPA